MLEHCRALVTVYTDQHSNRPDHVLTDGLTDPAGAARAKARARTYALSANVAKSRNPEANYDRRNMKILVII